MNAPELAKLTPNTTDEAIKVAEDIIALLSDGAAINLRLNKLRSELSVANATIEAAAKAAARTTAGERMMADATAILAQHSARTAQVAARESAVEAREQAIQAREADFQSKAAEIDGRDIALTARERQHEAERAAWQETVSRTQSELAAVREELRRRAELLRAATTVGKESR